MAELQTTILRGLIQDPDYRSKVIPHLKKTFFTNEHQVVFTHLCSFAAKYNKMPSKEAFQIELSDSPDINESNADHIYSIVEDAYLQTPIEFKWLMDKTEEWCSEQALFGAITKSIDILQGKDPNHDKGSIPEIIQKALSVSFDKSVGLDFLEDYERRYEFYTKIEDRIKFSIDILNTITDGGLTTKTLNILMAPTGVGKSLIMCDFATSNLRDGLNVLYITNEMAEERIGQRIDANILDTDINSIKHMTRDNYIKKFKKITSKTAGKLIVKEYPPAAANVNHYRALLQELAIKKGFKPDVIYVDYLNIMSSARLRLGGAVNTYSLVKSIAEELRGLAVEQDVAIITATQTNRDGNDNSDIDLGNTSESFGLPMTADLMIGVMQTEEMMKQGHYLFKQLKNRYGDLGRHTKFVIGVDKARMKLYEVASTGTYEEGVEESEDIPVMEKGTIASSTKQFEQFNFD